MKDFDRDANSRAVSISAQVGAPNDNDSEATGDTPPPSAEDRSAKDRGRQDAVGSTTESDPSHALSTQAERPAGAEAPGGTRTTVRLKRPILPGTVLQVFSNGRRMAMVVERVTRRMATPSERLGSPARGSGQDDEPAAKNPPRGGATAAASNAPTSAYTSSRVDDESVWAPLSPVASPRSTTVGETHDPTKSSRRIRATLGRQGRGPDRRRSSR